MTSIFKKKNELIKMIGPSNSYCYGNTAGQNPISSAVENSSTTQTLDRVKSAASQMKKTIIDQTQQN